MDEGLRTLYRWTQMTREVLMRALDGLGPERYQAPQATLAGDSVRDRHVHMAQCYIHWVARVGLEEDAASPRPGDFTEPRAVGALFSQVDAAVERMLTRYAGHLDEQFVRTVGSGERARFTPRWLISHPITHEFNHKGQIVVVARLFGVDPGDTDLAYPFERVSG